MARADVVTVPSLTTNNYAGASINYLVQTPSGVLYLIYIDNANDVCFRKSTDAGFSWSQETVVFTGTALAVSVWYDRWSGISGDLIHCAYIENVGHDVLYRSIDAASSDALSTETTIFNGVSATGGALSITRARGGNLGCIFNIDGGTEDGFAKSADVGATWAPAGDPTEGALDYWILLPGWAADNQDLMCFFWDTSANEISRKLYDDSANSWAETSIAASMVDVAASSSFPHFAAAVDTSRSWNLLVAWNGVDTALADLHVWTVTESTITPRIDAVANGTDDQGLCSVAVDTNTGTWYVFYFGKSDGSETWSTAVKLYYKSSSDLGATWSSETALTNATFSVRQLFAAPRFIDNFAPVWFNDGASTDQYMASISIPATGGGGLTLRRYFD